MSLIYSITSTITRDIEDILRKAVTEDTIERVQIFENQIRHLN